jgi:hypothetical protein
MKLLFIISLITTLITSCSKQLNFSYGVILAKETDERGLKFGVKDLRSLETAYFYTLIPEDSIKKVGDTSKIYCSPYNMYFWHGLP